MGKLKIYLHLLKIFLFEETNLKKNQDAAFRTRIFERAHGRRDGIRVCRGFEEPRLSVGRNRWGRQPDPQSQWISSHRGRTLGGLRPQRVGDDRDDESSSRR